jgi:glycosyltransferase involved in cell wall biosynthesis
MIRVLNLYSNDKWTGPADHALNLTALLSKNRDFQAYFACGRRKGLPNHLQNKADERHVPHFDNLRLNKHLNWTLIPDVFALKKIVARESIGLIHSHQNNDALTAVLAGFGNILMRTCYEGEPEPLNLRQRFFFRNTARIMTASIRVKAYLSQIFPEKWIEQVDIPVDIKKFRPAPKSEKLCQEFGITRAEPVAGIVARVQKHRDFPLLLNAMEEVVREIPRFKLLIVGRGTHIDTVARQRVIRKGLQNNVVFTGYRSDDYRDVLNLFDYKIFLHPGSDGACRAVREALACGKPVVATRRGILQELINNGETGMLVDDQPHDLAEAMITMCREDEYRQKCSSAARKYAIDILSPERYVAKVLGCYKSMGTN